MSEFRSDQLTGTEKGFNDELEIVEKSLTRLVDDVTKTHPESPPAIYVFGSLGRRLAISQAERWPEYAQATLENPRLAPRKSLRDQYDADIAVPINSVPWPVLTSISRKISKEAKRVEIDPHFIDINTGDNTLRHQDSTISSNNFVFKIKTIDFSVAPGLPPLKIPDMWSQMLFYLSSKRVRPRDMPEIEMLAEGLIKSGELSNKPRVKEALEIARKNKRLLSLKNIARWPYWIAVPYPLRVKIAHLRHVPNADIRGYDNPEPVFF